MCALNTTVTDDMSLNELEELCLQKAITWGVSYRETTKSAVQRMPLKRRHSPINVSFNLCRALQKCKKNRRKKKKQCLIKSSAHHQQSQAISLLDRSAMSQNQYMELLSVPNETVNKIEKRVKKKQKKCCRCLLESCSPRLIQMAVPKKQYVLETWKMYQQSLPAEVVLRFDRILRSGNNDLNIKDAHYYFKRVDRKKAKEARKKKLKKKKLKMRLARDQCWLKIQISKTARAIIKHLASLPVPSMNHKQMVISNQLLAYLRYQKAIKTPITRSTRNVYKASIIEVSDKLVKLIDDLSDVVHIQPLDSKELLQIPSLEELLEIEEEEEEEEEEEGEGEGEEFLFGEEEEEEGEGLRAFAEGEDYEDFKLAEFMTKKLLDKSEAFDRDEAEDANIDFFDQYDRDALEKLIAILSNSPPEFLDQELGDSSMPGVTYRDILSKLKDLRDGKIAAMQTKRILEDIMVEWAKNNEPEQVNEQLLEKIHETSNILSSLFVDVSQGATKGMFEESKPAEGETGEADDAKPKIETITEEGFVKEEAGGELEGQPPVIDEVATKEETYDVGAERVTPSVDEEGKPKTDDEVNVENLQTADEGGVKNVDEEGAQSQAEGGAKDTGEEGAQKQDADADENIIDELEIEKGSEKAPDQESPAGVVSGADAVPGEGESEGKKTTGAEETGEEGSQVAEGEDKGPGEVGGAEGEEKGPGEEGEEKGPGEVGGAEGEQKGPGEVGEEGEQEFGGAEGEEKGPGEVGGAEGEEKGPGEVGEEGEEKGPGEVGEEGEEKGPGEVGSAEGEEKGPAEVGEEGEQEFGGAEGEAGEKKLGGAEGEAGEKELAGAEGEEISSAKKKPGEGVVADQREAGEEGMEAEEKPKAKVGERPLGALPGEDRKELEKDELLMIIRGHKPAAVYDHSPDTICCLSLKVWAIWLLEIAHNAHNWTKWIADIIKQVRQYAAIIRGDVVLPNGQKKVLYKREWREFIKETEEKIVAWRQYSKHVKDLSNEIMAAFHGKKVNCCPKCLEDHMIKNVVVAHDTFQALKEAINCAEYWQRCLDRIVEQTGKLTNIDVEECKDEASITSGSTSTVIELEEVRVPYSSQKSRISVMSASSESVYEIEELDPFKSI